ncbi:sigma-54 dependent transcriptional regulator, partial [bacterium]|nr:sigma-54 dependent transcriptional regulator [bacterium]
PERSALGEPGRDDAPAIELPIGREGDAGGTLRAERDAPFDDADRAWIAAASALLALGVEGHLERLDHVASEAPDDDAVESCGDLVGASRAMREVYRLIGHVAPTSTSALLLGESGTGKELAARAIHTRSPRRGAAFVAINCPSIPRELIESELFGHEKGAFTGADSMRPGKVEVADGGTLFLDEVGDMAIGTQVKLLRFLEERQFQRVGGTANHAVDVRILAATSRDLDEAIARGEFREDLYYRLNVVPIRMPSLRERREDLPQLVTHLLARVATAGRETPPRISAGTMDRLMAYDWPGNVRELRNTLEYMATIGKGDVLDERHLPASLARAAAKAPAPAAPSAMRAGESLESRLQELEATLVRATLEAEDWNQSAAARRLGITESKIRNRMKQFGIRRPSEDQGGTS